MIVTRFAPSPTGKLHVGNMRTALMNYLLTRKMGGRFILRIDDTDQARSREEYVDAIRRDLEWLGVEWDQFERQSRRLERYKVAADELRAGERLYAAYETPEEIELKRRKLLNMGKPPVYDRSALKLKDADRAALEAEGRQPHWRFLLEHRRVGWDDLIRGATEIDCASVSDPVLIRGDGQFLYTLCSVCDDVDMGVTHVIRGEDHVTNTATQIQIFAALGAQPTAFAHASLLTGVDGGGLSKRLGSLSIEDMREEGMEPMAILSLLARLGSSDPIEPRLDMQDLIEGFDIARFGRAPAKFDPAEVTALNSKIVRGLPFEAVADDFAGLALPDPEGFWLLVRDNLDKRTELAEWIKMFEWPHLELVADEDAVFIAEALPLLEGMRPWTSETWGKATAALKERTGRKGKGLFMPLRLALTGRNHGPDMGALLPHLDV